MKIRLLRLLGVLCVLCILCVAVSAATFTVTNVNDSGAGSLRQAIIDANGAAGADTIQFNLPAGVQTIALTSGAINITDSLTIYGMGANRLTVSGSNLSQVFTATAAEANVTINNLTVRAGRNATSGGGAIYNHGIMTLNYVAVLDSFAGSFGGGIFNDNSLNINNSLIAENRADIAGGGLTNGGGAICNVKNSTFFSNNARVVGGGIYNDRGGLTLVFVTMMKNGVVGNTDPAGGGIRHTSANGSYTNVQNTIITGSSTTNATGRDVSGDFTSLGYNFVGTTAGSTGFGSGSGDIINQPGTSGLEGDLRDNGGEMQSLALRAGGAEINAGNPVSSEPIDQRGFQRPADGRRDIGAFEFNAAPPPPPAPDLQSGSDTGISQTDNLTNSRAPVFDINAAPGSSIELLRGSTVAASGIVNSSGSIALADPNPPANGFTDYRARVIGFGTTGQILTVNYDTNAPTVTVNQAAAQSDPANGSSIQFDVQFSEPVGSIGGFAVSGAVNVGSVGYAPASPGSQTNFIAFVSLQPSVGTLGLSLNPNAAFDAAGNGSAASTSTDNTVAVYLPDYLVTKIADTDDGSCSPTDCSLREAIRATNTRTDGSTPLIGFDAAIFGSAQTITLSLGQLNIGKNVAIYGRGAALTSISGNDAVRVFNISGGTVSLNDLTVTDGRANSGSGGGILIFSMANATLNTAVVTSSISFDGGGIFNNGTLTLNNTTLSGNTATGSGGGILNNGGTVTVNDSTLSDNTATFAGSGIANTNTVSAANFTLNRSRVTGGTASANGAIHVNSGTMTLNESVVSGYTLNYSSGNSLAGGIFSGSGATLVLNKSTVSGNTVNAPGNTTVNFAGGVYNLGTATLTDSTVSGNTVNGGGIAVGGVYNAGSLMLRLTNSTVSGNRALNGANSTSGGVRNATGSGSTLITNSTITDNEAVGSTNPTSGVFAFDTTIRNSVVADNRDSFNVPEVRNTFTSQGNNYIGSAASSSGWITTGANADVLNAAAGAARLLPLADNGGAVQTHALALDSPLIDRGSNCVLTVNGCGNNNPAITTDARGENRQIGATVDIGAFEYVYDCAVDTVSIAAQPQNLSVRAGQPIVFSVNLTGSEPRTIKWQISQNGGATWTDIAGAGAETLNLGNADIHDNLNGSRYRAVITRACGGQLTSDVVTLTVTQATGAGGTAACQNLSVRASGWFRAADNATNIVTGQTGNLFNGATFAAGKTGRSFSLDGTDDYVTVPSVNLTPPNQISIEAWVNFRNLNGRTSGGAPAGTQYLVFKQNSRSDVNFNGYALRKERDAATGKDYLAFVISDRNGLQQKVVSTVEITAGNWYHAVGTFDGANLRIYVNGQNAVSINIDPGFAGLDYNSNNVVFGATNNSFYDGKLNGLLDEIKIYNQALSASEVAASYNADSAGTCLFNRWTGVSNTDWSNGTNWSAGVAPAGTNSAYVFGGTPNSPVISSPASILVENLSLAGNNLTVGAGASLSVSGAMNVDGTLNVAGNFTPYPAATISGGGTFNFSGTNGQTIPAQIYPRLTINTFPKILGGNITVLYALDLSAGRIATGASKITVSPNASVSRFSGSTANGYVVGSVEKQFAAGAGNSFTFPVGTANGYSPVTVSNVAGAGSLTVSATQGAYPNATGLPMNRAARWWTLSNNGLSSADVVFNYLAGDITAGTEANYKLYHIESGAATNVGGTIDTTAKTISLANVTQFSDWTLAEPFVPTAANVSIGGRVLTADGRGVYKALVSITDANGNVRYAMTNPFGFYRFADVPAGASCVVSVVHKQFDFTPQVINITESLTEINFVAAPE